MIIEAHVAVKMQKLIALVHDRPFNFLTIYDVLENVNN